MAGMYGMSPVDRVTWRFYGENADWFGSVSEGGYAWACVELDAGLHEALEEVGAELKVPEDWNLFQWATLIEDEQGFAYVNYFETEDQARDSLAPYEAAWATWSIEAASSVSFEG